MEDIKAAEDVDLLVELFYEKIRESAILFPHFAKIDWNTHLPKMKQFWRFILLNEVGYKTNVTEIHLSMNLSKSLFKEWLEIFNSIVDANFFGPNADHAKHRALIISIGIQSKMDLI